MANHPDFSVSSVGFTALTAGTRDLILEAASTVTPVSVTVSTGNTETLGTATFTHNSGNTFTNDAYYRVTDQTLTLQNNTSFDEALELS